MALGWNTSAQISTVRTDASAFALDEGHLMDLFDLKPQRYIKIPKETKEFYIQYDTEMGSETLAESNFFAIMGHNLRTADVVFKVQTSDHSTFNGSGNTVTVSDADYTGHTKLINAAAHGSSNEWINPADNGWTLFTWTDNTSSNNNRYVRITFSEDLSAGTNFANDLYLGGICYGEYFDWPVAAQVTAQTGLEFDGTKVLSSSGGSEYSNSTHFGGPMMSHTPWMMNYASDTNIGPTGGNPYYFFNPIGRRNLSLDFNYTADTNLFPENRLSTVVSESYDSADIVTQFYSRILGPHNPVLFSINNSSTDESDYGFYRLQNDLSATQIASQTWNFNLDLRETW
jgi:hypothetical protein